MLYQSIINIEVNRAIFNSQTTTNTTLKFRMEDYISISDYVLGVSNFTNKFS